MEDFDAQALDDSDLEASFYSALSLLRIPGYSVKASFKPFASVRHGASIDGKEISVEVSDAYRLSSREVILGLALDLCGRLFRHRVDNGYVRAFREFSKKGALYGLSDSIRMVRGRKRKENHEGKAHDLSQIGREVFLRYSHVLGLNRMPGVFWNDRGGRRVLAFYDRAFDSVLVSRIFDSEGVPRFVLEYLCFHEFLHSKYEPLYERGESRRVIVHSTAFRRDERLFEKFAETEAWLAKNVRSLSAI